MVRVVGVRFKPAGKVYYFDPSELEIPAGSCVVVETARGVEYGEVAVGTREVTEEQIVEPLKKVLRLGSDKDATVAADNKRKEQEAFGVAQKKIEAHGLEMSLVDVEYTFDGSKVIFYFTAEGRIDFRELVRDLAGVFRTRIEMRQIGVRDEAKLLGGIGPCGRILCCTSFLGDFAPVSIRMAKDQNLSLNPSKISGLCGRLMCCLRYEQDTYEAAKKDPTLAPGYVPSVLLADGDADSDLVALEDRPARRPSMPQSRSLSRPVEEAAVAFSARIAQAAGLASEEPQNREELPVAGRESLPEQRQKPKRAQGVGAVSQPRREPEAGRQPADSPKRSPEARVAGGGRAQRQQPPRREGATADQPGEQQLQQLPGEKLNGQRFQGGRNQGESTTADKVERPRRDRRPHDRRRPQNERPEGERPQGEHPQDERQQAVRAQLVHPQRVTPQGDQAPAVRAEGEGERRRRHHRGRRRSGGGAPVATAPEQTPQP